jgi:site-specific DNA recombinase
MKNNSLRCAIYIRVSTEEQHLNGLSLPAQKEALLDYAKKNNYTVVGIYADEGISARKSMKYRKGLLSLLDDVKAGKIDMILVTKLDRWFRNIKDYNITEEILQAHNCHWKTIFENYDSSTANGQMVINIMLSVNQAECDRTSERIKAVFDYKRANGQVTSGMCAPWGYKVENSYMMKDEAVSDIIEDAYKYYFTCYSRRKTIAYIKDKYPDRAPSSGIIDFLFKNEKYTGRYKENINYCEPYISIEEFERIKSITQAKIYPKTEHTYIFSSLIICPVCGKKMTGFLKKQKLKNGLVSIYPRYKCSQRYDKHPTACLTETTVENYMIDSVSKNLSRYLDVQLDFKSKELISKTNISRLQDELSRLNIMFQKGRISEDFYDSEYKKLEDEMRDAANIQSAKIVKRYQELSNNFSGNWLDIYTKLDNEHKRAFWKSTISEIHVDEKTHKLCGFKFLI